MLKETEEQVMRIIIFKKEEEFKNKNMLFYCNASTQRTKYGFTAYTCAHARLFWYNRKENKKMIMKLPMSLLLL